MNYPSGSIHQAEPIFEAEVQLIRQLGLEDTLAQIVEFGDHLHRRKVAFHLIGAGGSSIIFYLLGFSPVDPIRYGTYFQRFWLTASCEPPKTLFIVMPSDDMPCIVPPHPPLISAHPMTAKEGIPELFQARYPCKFDMKSRKAVFQTIQGGDTNGIFQLESESVRSLMAQIGPSRICDLGITTALELIGFTHPEVVTEYLQQRLARRDNRLQRPVTEKELTPFLPLLFQETIMKLLHRHGGLDWEETYSFVQAAAKGRMTDQHRLWKPAREGMEKHHGATGEMLLEKLIAASRWAVCKAHHVANAITSYRAAYYRTFHLQQFEDTLQQMSRWERGK